MTGTGGVRKKLGIEAKVRLGEVDGRREVLGHVADAERGRGRRGAHDVGLGHVANWREHEVEG